MAAAEKILDVAEQTQEIVEETLDVLEAVPAWRCGLSRKQHALQIVALMAIGGAVGGVAAYYICRKKLTTKYEKIAAKEISEAKDFYRAVYKKDEYKTPQETVKTLQSDSGITEVRVEEAANALRKYHGDVDSPEVVVEEESLTVFSEEGEGEEDENELVEAHVHLISIDDYLSAEPGYEQEVWTYYVGDETLANQEDEMVEHVEDYIGPDTLMRFGEESEDPRSVYVRNHKYRTDYHIVMNDRKFSHEVLGLQHSDEAHFEKMHHRRRGGDE